MSATVVDLTKAVIVITSSELHELLQPNAGAAVIDLSKSTIVVVSSERLEALVKRVLGIREV